MVQKEVVIMAPEPKIRGDVKNNEGRTLIRKDYFKVNGLYSATYSREEVKKLLKQYLQHNQSR